MNYKLAVILTLLSFGCKPKPEAAPILLADNRVEPAPILMQDNGRTVMTVRDADIPVGPCDLGKLVRAARAELGSTYSFAIRETLRAELARCSPKPEPGR